MSDVGNERSERTALRAAPRERFEFREVIVGDRRCSERSIRALFHHRRKIADSERRTRLHSALYVARIERDDALALVSTVLASTVIETRPAPPLQREVRDQLNANEGDAAESQDG